MILDKILDKYYSIKLKNSVAIIFSMYNLEYKFVSVGSYVRIYVKRNKYKEYEELFSFNKEDSLFYLIHIEDFKEEIKRKIKFYNDSFGIIPF